MGIAKSWSGTAIEIFSDSTNVEGYLSLRVDTIFKLVNYTKTLNQTLSLNIKRIHTIFISITNPEDEYTMSENEETRRRSRPPNLLYIYLPTPPGLSSQHNPQSLIRFKSIIFTFLFTFCQTQNRIFLLNSKADYFMMMMRMRNGLGGSGRG